MSKEGPQKTEYLAMMLLQSMDEIRRSIILALAHIYPKKVTATQLSLISGYSIKSKYLYKSRAINLLDEEDLIQVERIGKRLMHIQLNYDNILLRYLVELCLESGEKITNSLLKMLEEDLSDD